MIPEVTQSAAKTVEKASNGAQVKSAVRVLDLLEYAQRIQRPFKAVELRSALNWPASSTQMILETVVESGYLIFNSETKQYFPSPRVVTLGEWLGNPGGDLSGATDVLNEIAEETGETVTFSIENNYSAQCVKVVPGRKPTPVDILEGLRAPLTCSAAGLATLMAKSDGQALSIVKKSRELSPFARDSYSRTIETVHQFRREGRALVYGRLWPESCWISVPVKKTYNKVPITISAGGDIATMRRREDTVTHAMLSAISRWCA